MRVLSDPPLAWVPSRGPLQSASLGPVTLYLSSYLLVCLSFSDPLVLSAAVLGASLAGIGAGCRRAVLFSLRLGLAIAAFLVVVNGLVSGRGSTVLGRLGEWPLFGMVNVTAEALAAGSIIGLRALGTMVVIGVWSAAVDPDRILRAVHRVARRSALTATLVSRLVPLAVNDQARLAEAASLRGPGAAPVTRAVSARRLLTGSLDRSVDVAATLELRGYSRSGTPTPPARQRSRYDLRFRLAGLTIISIALITLLTGGSGLDAYPTISWQPGPVSVLLALALVAGGTFTWPGRKVVRGSGH